MDDSGGRIFSFAREIADNERTRTAGEGSPASLSHHARLKRGTAAQHSEAEEAVDRLNPFASTERYRRFILNNLAFYRALEGWAEACGVRSLLDDWPERRKQDVLVADAQALAAFPDEVPETLHGIMPAAPASQAILLGALYVTEGATLGAAVLANRARRIGFSATWGARFFHAYGDARSSRWLAFLQVLNAAPLGRRDVDEAVQSARHTFETYRCYVVVR